jgi:hypothetical protein
MMKVTSERIQLAILALAVIGVGISIMFIVFAYDFMRRAVISTEPSQAVRVTLVRSPESGPYCPGEYVNFGVRIKPLRWPIATRVAVTLWDRDKERTAVTEKLGGERVLIYTDGSTVTTVDSFYIPRLDRAGDPMAPGRYEVRLAAIVEGASAAVVTMPFVIPGSCKKGEENKAK